MCAFALLACLALAAPGASFAAKKPAKPKVKVKPDVSIPTAPTVNGATLAGGRVQLSAGVHSGKVAVKASKTAFYVSANAAYDKKDQRLALSNTAGLKPKSQLTLAPWVTLPATLKGSFFVIACADSASKLDELSEKNNCRASAKQTIKPPFSTLSFAATRSVAEGNSGSANMLAYDIALSAPYPYPVSFDWTAGGGTDTSSASDLASTRGTVTIPAGATSVTVNVGVAGDTKSEPDETVALRVYDPVNAVFAGANAIIASSTILDDDLNDVTVRTTGRTSTSVTLVFDHAPTNILADGSQFVVAENDDDVEVIGATIAGNVVTLTTTEQESRTYTLSLVGLQSGLRTFPATKTFRGVAG